LTERNFTGLFIILMLFVFFSAFFSFAETGLMAINRYRLRHQAQQKKRYALRILQLLKRPDRLLGTILIGNTFANMLASAVATIIANHLWGEKGAIVVAAVLAFIILIFAEITPKTFAALYPERTARIVIYPIYFFLYLFYPIVWSANVITNGLLRIARIKTNIQTIEPLNREELRSVVYETAGKMSRQYQLMLLGILDLNKMAVEDAMIPQHEIYGIDIEQPWESVLDRIKQTTHEWVPVYRDNINQIVGVLYLRDITSALLDSKLLNKEFLLSILREPYFVPEGTLLHIQLAHFQKERKRVAFVVDEYGEISGLLTLRDIVEEIVGDFTTSVAQVAQRIQQQKDGSYLVDGAITVREFNRVTQWELPLRGPRTINGLIVESLESLPRTGTCVLITHYPIEIIEVKDNRVKKARIFAKVQS